MALPWLIGCGSPPLSVEIEAAQRPPDFDQLDELVKQQFEQLEQERKAAAARERGTSELADAWGRLGQWFHVYSYPASAASAYRNAQRLDPSDARWPYYLGSLAEEAGELDSAAEAYRRSAELAADLALPQIRLGELALRRHELEAAASSFREAGRREPENARAAFGLASVALASGDARLALERLKILEELQPDASDVHHALAVAYRQLGEHEAADRHLARVPENNLDQVALASAEAWDQELRLFDVGSRTLTRRGVVASRRGQDAVAARLLGRAVAADPDGADERVNYAQALSELGRHAAALEQLRAALELADPASEPAARAHLVTGRLLASRGRFKPARRHLELALGIDPQATAPLLELARIELFQGQFDAALERYVDLRGRAEEVKSVRFWHAAVLLLLDRCPDAIAQLQSDLERFGRDRLLELLLARTLSTCRDGALRDGEQARRLLLINGRGPGQELEEGQGQGTDVFFAETAAMVAAENARFEEAQRWQRLAIDATAGLRPRSSAQRARRRLVLYERHEPCRVPWEHREILLDASIDLDAPVNGERLEPQEASP